MEAAVSRKMLRTLEPYHGMIYFVPEAAEAYGALGLTGRRMGYFASRAAPMGPVPAEVVIATFFNFFPDLVRASIPEAWARAEPAAIVQARFDAADRALRRMLGDAVTSADMEEAAVLARTAAEACYSEGHPLYAGHAAQDWPDAPHLVLWHAQSLLREFRGDGHIAAMCAEGIAGPEALVIHGATGDIAPAVLQTSRAWPDDLWAEATERVRERGWLTADGTLTAAGQTSRDWVEHRTDDLALVCWEHLGEEGCTRLRELVRPYSRVIVDQAFALTEISWDD